MKLWIRVIWRILKWPLNVVLLTVPIVAAFYLGQGHVHSSTDTTDARGWLCILLGCSGSVLAVAGGVAMGIEQFLLTDWFSDAFTVCVKEEAKAMQVERSQQAGNSNTLLRPAGKG